MDWKSCTTVNLHQNTYACSAPTQVWLLKQSHSKWILNTCFFLQRPHIGLYCFTSVVAPSSTEQTSTLCSGWASLGCLLLVKVTSWDLNQDFLSPALRLAPWTTFCSQDFKKSVKQLVQFFFVHKVKMKCKDFASESFTEPSCRKHCVSRKQYFRSESFVRFFQRLVTCLL